MLTQTPNRHLPLSFLVVVAAYAPVAWAQMAGAHQTSLRLIDEGRYTQARDHAAQALREAPAGADPCQLAVLHFDKGVAEQLLVQYKEAAASLAHAAGLCGSGASAPPRFVAALFATLGQVHATLGLFDEASLELRTALEAAEALPPGDERRARVHDAMGVLLQRQGLPSQAEHHLRRAIAILRTNPAQPHPDVAAVEMTLAGVLLEQKRAPEALALAQRARSTLLATLGPAHPDSIAALVTVAAARVESAPLEAENMLREAMAAWRAQLPEKHLVVMSIWNATGAAQLSQGRPREAVGSFAQALDIARAVAGPEGEETMRAMYRYAGSLKAAKRRKDSNAMFAEADRIRHSKGYANPGQNVIDIRSFRGR